MVVVLKKVLKSPSPIFVSDFRWPVVEFVASSQMATVYHDFPRFQGSEARQALSISNVSTQCPTPQYFGP